MSDDLIQNFYPRWCTVLPYTSVPVQVTFPTSQIPGDTLQVKLYNTGSSMAFVGAGSSLTAAVNIPTSGAISSGTIPLPPANANDYRTYDFGSANTIAVSGNAGASGNLYITDGQGA